MFFTYIILSQKKSKIDGKCVLERCRSNINFLKSLKSIFNIPVNPDGNKLFISHKVANIFTVSRNSYHPIDALWISLVPRPSTAER